MKTGLCGAQRVGKTTLAKAYAAASGRTFQATQTSSILDSIGMSAKIQYPIEQRLFAQEKILENLMIQWGLGPNSIFDRTPLDVLAYMEADVLRNFPQNAELEQRYMTYRAKCLDAAQDFHIILIQPGIAIVEETTSAPGCLPYMEHLNSLMFGYITDLCLNRDMEANIMPRKMLDLQERIDYLTKVTGGKS